MCLCLVCEHIEIFGSTGRRLICLYLCFSIFLSLNTRLLSISLSLYLSVSLSLCLSVSLCVYRYCLPFSLYVLSPLLATSI